MFWNPCTFYSLFSLLHTNELESNSNARTRTNNCPHSEDCRWWLGWPEHAADDSTYATAIVEDENAWRVWWHVWRLFMCGLCQLPCVKGRNKHKIHQTYHQVSKSKDEQLTGGEKAKELEGFCRPAAASSSSLSPYCSGPRDSREEGREGVSPFALASILPSPTHPSLLCSPLFPFIPDPPNYKLHECNNYLIWCAFGSVVENRHDVLTES